MQIRCLPEPMGHLPIRWNTQWQIQGMTVTRTGTIGMEFIERVEVYEKYISGDALSDVETQVEEVTKRKRNE